MLGSIKELSAYVGIRNFMAMDIRAAGCSWIRSNMLHQWKNQVVVRKLDALAINRLDCLGA